MAFMKFLCKCAWISLTLVTALAACAIPSPTLTPFPTARPTFAFPTGTAVPITSAENSLIETEPGPLYVMLSTVDEHGLRGAPLIDVVDQPNGTNVVGSVPPGVFAQVLEIRRLPPDYLRSFYRVRTQADDIYRSAEGWVGDWLVRRTVYVVAFDEQGCACPFPLPLWTDAALSQESGNVMNRSPLRLLALGDEAVQVQVLSDGTLGWLDKDLVHESQENEFLKYIAPLSTP